MAHVKNWQPDMTIGELDWFDRCPKAVLFEIARQFGMRVADNFTMDAGFAAMVEEWSILHANGIVPQRPAALRSDDELLAKMHPEIRRMNQTS